MTAVKQERGNPVQFNPMGDAPYPALRFVGWSLAMVYVGYLIGSWP